MRVNRRRRIRNPGRSPARLLQQLEQRRLTEILLQIDAGGKILGIDVRHRQSGRPEVAREPDERGVFAVFDPDGGPAVPRFQPEELSVGAMRLQRAGVGRRNTELDAEELCKAGMHGSEH